MLGAVVHSGALKTPEGNDLLPDLLARKWSILQEKQPRNPALTNLPCTHLLTARQLEQLEPICPGINMDSGYISARVRTMLPPKAEDLKAESPKMEAVRRYVESLTGVMPRDFLKVKARILLSLMWKLRKEKDLYDESLLLE